MTYDSIRTNVCELPLLAFSELGQSVDLRVVEDVVSMGSWDARCVLFQGSDAGDFGAEFETIPLFCVSAENFQIGKKNL